MSNKFNRAEADMELDDVSYFNEYKSTEAIKCIKALKGVKDAPLDGWLLPPDGSLMTFDGNFFVAHGPNKAEFIPGKRYTPFMVFNKLAFKLNTPAAINHIRYHLRGNEIPYVRVGTDFFKQVPSKDRFGIERMELKVWKKDAIVLDHGEPFLRDIPRYDGFTMQPDNVNFDLTPDNRYNLYYPFSHTPEKGDWKWTEILLRHIFGDKFEMGLKYMQVLYLHPTKTLPILVLASKERGTGKTTFLNWIAQIFGDNYVVITPQDFVSAYNSSYTSANIIGIEETEDDKKSTVHKIKALSTSKLVTVNPKFVTPYKLAFFGKFIITSNEPDSFLRIDEEEIRFWVQILTHPKHFNAAIEENLVTEIPAFLYHLTTLPPVDFSRSRMVFTPEEIATDALAEVKAESRSGLHQDIELLVEEYFLNNPDVHELQITAGEIKEHFFPNNSRIEPHYIRKVLTKKMGKEAKLCKYTPISDKLMKKTGRVFTFYRDPLM